MHTDEFEAANVSLFDWKQSQEQIAALKLQVIEQQKQLIELQKQIAELRENVASIDRVVYQLANYYE